MFQNHLALEHEIRSRRRHCGRIVEDQLQDVGREVERRVGDDPEWFARESEPAKVRPDHADPVVELRVERAGDEPVGPDRVAFDRPNPSAFAGQGNCQRP